MSTARVSAALTAPPAEVGLRVLALPEDQWFDRKSVSVSREKVAQLEVAFANAEGGVAVVGASSGRVDGTRSAPDRVNALRQAALDLTVPVVPHRVELVPCLNDAGEPDELLAIWVEPGTQVHTTHKDEVYLRVGDETRKLSYDQRRELLFDKGQAAYEAQRVAGAGFGVLDQDVVDGYAAALGHRNAERLLTARGLAVEGELTTAGALLFAEYPQRWFPEAFVRVLRYRGTGRGTGARQQIDTDVRFEGPLPVQITDAYEAIRRVQPTRRALGRSGRFEDVPLVPEDAWMEALVNAVVHRSYSVSGDHIRVEAFDDRIEVSSPGRFPGLVRLDDPLNAVRYARNPRIARVLADLRFGQELGEGIRRMFEEMRAAGLDDPLYRQTSGSVHVVLSGEPVDRALDAALPDETRTIVSALREADRLSTGEVQELLGLGRPATLRRLDALLRAGVVQWVGKSARDPRAYWRLP
ncbi:MAG TPA: ATP-binding protein [Frankiaceae bacterium]|nr:ATP-binding protein [Frankiaceae bacterium]